MDWLCALLSSSFPSPELRLGSALKRGTNKNHIPALFPRSKSTLCVFFHGLCREQAHSSQAVSMTLSLPLLLCMGEEAPQALHPQMRAIIGEASRYGGGDFSRLTEGVDTLCGASQSGKDLVPSPELSILLSS